MTTGTGTAVTSQKALVRSMGRSRWWEELGSAKRGRRAGSSVRGRGRVHTEDLVEGHAPATDEGAHEPSAQHNEEQQEDLHARDLPADGLQVGKRAGPQQPPSAEAEQVEEAEAGVPKLPERDDACREEVVLDLGDGLTRRTLLLLINAGPLAVWHGAGVAGAGGGAGAGLLADVWRASPVDHHRVLLEDERRLLHLASCRHVARCTGQRARAAASVTVGVF